MDISRSFDCYIDWAHMSEQTKRIFICDDQPIVIEGVKQVVSSTGQFSLCGSALTLEDAAEKIQHKKPDLVILDLFVTGADSTQLINKKWLNGCAFSSIFYTAHNESVFIERALKLGAKACVIKQEPVENLLKAIDDVLKNKIYVSPLISQQIYQSFVNVKTMKYADPLNSLSPKEKHILKLLGRGYRRKDIASTLLISAKTVDTHTDRIKVKLSINDSSKLHLFASRFYHLIN